MAFLDALRGVAAMAVFISHVAERVSPTLRNLIYTCFDLGHFGVILFFLCSGFIIPFSLERQNSLSHFWISRIFRLYPLYWFTIGISIILHYVSSARLLPGSLPSANLATILGNMTMLQLFIGVPLMRAEYWTLTIEMMFYVVMSLLFSIGIHKHTIKFTLGLTLVALLTETLLPLAFGVQFRIGFFSFLTIIFMGTTLYRIYSGATSTRVGVSTVAVGALMLLVSTLAKGIGEGGMWEYINLMLARLAAVVVFSLAFLVRLRRPPRFMLYLGTISYSLYLIQPYIMIIEIGNRVLQMLIWFLALLTAATATYFWIERPGILCGRQLSRRLSLSSHQPKSARPE